jgi:hypothetical protein
MSEIQWSHTLHILLNQKKQDSLVFQTGVSDFSCNGYISNSGCFNFQIQMFQFLLASFQRLVFGGQV